MKKAFVIGSLLVVLTLSVGGSAISKGTDSGATYEQLRLFTEVLSIVQNQYVDETEPREVIYGAVRGMLRALDAEARLTLTGRILARAVRADPRALWRRSRGSGA